MRLRQIENMDIVSDTAAVGSVVIVAENHQFIPFAAKGLQDYRNKVAFRTVIFAMEGEKEVGFALYFFNFSTFLGRAGLYLEDLFVLPEYRGRGYGKGLLAHLAAIAVEKGCGRMEWVCLDWNQPSIDFYKSKNAVPLEDWTIYRLTGDTLTAFAKEDPA